MAENKMFPGKCGVFKTYGHAVKLTPPQFVKPYVKTDKNDYNDAEAIAEAASRPSMRFFPSVSYLAPALIRTFTQSVLPFTAAANSEEKPSVLRALTSAPASIRRSTMSLCPLPDANIKAVKSS